MLWTIILKSVTENIYVKRLIDIRFGPQYLIDIELGLGLS